MANIYDFSSDNVSVFLMVLDSSNSMSNDTKKVKDGLKSYKKEFEDFYEADSIAVAISKFSDDYYPGEFNKVKDISTSYNTGGATALYYSIKRGAKQLVEYIRKVTEKTGTIPRGTFIFFSDGEPYNDKEKKENAKKAISDMNEMGITTVFVAFGKAISSNFGDELGFQATVDVKDRDSLVEFMGEELSKSCKEQSRSMKALGSNFFSHANDNESSSGYSNITSQALEDDDWIDSI